MGSTIEFYNTNDGLMCRLLEDSMVDESKIFDVSKCPNGCFSVIEILQNRVDELVGIKKGDSMIDGQKQAFPQVKYRKELKGHMVPHGNVPGMTYREWLVGQVAGPIIHAVFAATYLHANEGVDVAKDLIDNAFEKIPIHIDRAVDGILGYRKDEDE